MKRIAVVLFVLLLLLLICGCGDIPAQAPTAAPAWELLPTPPHETSTPETDVPLLSPVFEADINNFIELFNAKYASFYGRTLLYPADEWSVFEPSDVSPFRRLRFQPKPFISSDPTITVYEDPSSDAVTRITFDFSDHGYTEWGYELFEKMCPCGLAVLLPALNESEIAHLYDELFQCSNDEAYLATDSEDPEYLIVFHSGDILLHPYYCAGMAHISAKKTSTQQLDLLRDQGVTVIEYP